MDVTQVNLISTRKNGQLGLKAKALIAVYVLLAIATRGFLVAALLFVTLTLKDFEQKNLIDKSWKQGSSWESRLSELVIQVSWLILVTN